MDTHHHGLLVAAVTNVVVVVVVMGRHIDTADSPVVSISLCRTIEHASACAIQTLSFYTTVCIYASIIVSSPIQSVVFLLSMKDELWQIVQSKAVEKV